MVKRIKTGGRGPGTKNRLTKDIKTAFQNLVENNLSNVEIWLDEVADDNPGKALDFILKLAEFVVPKMRSAEIQTNSGGVGNAIEDMTKEEILKRIESYRLPDDIYEYDTYDKKN